MCVMLFTTDLSGFCAGCVRQGHDLQGLHGQGHLDSGETQGAVHQGTERAFCLMPTFYYQVFKFNAHLLSFAKPVYTGGQKFHSFIQITSHTHLTFDEV